MVQFVGVARTAGPGTCQPTTVHRVRLLPRLAGLATSDGPPASRAKPGGIAVP